MKKSETSTSWVEFLEEFQAKCEEQKVSLSELAEWIRTSIDQIEKKTFDYYMYGGKVQLYPDQILDISILLDGFIYTFTLFKDRREFVIYLVKSFQSFSEEIFGDSIRHSFYITESYSLFFEDKIINSAGLRNFSRKILNASWGI